MKRRKAREKILQILFQIDMAKIEVKEAIQNVLEVEDENIEEYEVPFIEDRVYGTYKNIEKIDKELSKHLKSGWSLSRLSSVDRSILRMATYELLYTNDDVSTSVSLNEAIELAKIFGSDESPKFVNGVLGSVVKANSTIASDH